MTRQLFFSIVFIFLAKSLLAQSPYFQQEVDYKIQVQLNDKAHSLSANETIVYKNNSPDELKELWFHIWPNAYRDRNTALAKQKLENGSTKLYFATDDEKGFIDSLDFAVNGKKIKWEFHPEWQDVCKLILDAPLRPGESISIATPFYVKIPSAQLSRLGHTGQAYFITQWYPKPAVYDNKGWHAMPFLDIGEFYSEFGSFEVSISLPKNYVVGATGDLLNNDSELQWLNQKAEETKSKTVFDTNLAFPKSDTEFKTITFRQSNVHDFAWFADKRFHVLKGEVITPHNHNVVTTWTMFTNNEPKLWMKSIEYMNDAIYFYSLWNSDYPYKQCTAIDGTIAAGGGMEYPNVTVISECGDDFTLEDVIVHEVGHNWFYGMLGSNEREHAWMDEGMNSFNEQRYVMTKYPPDKFGNKNDLQSFGKVGKLLGVDKMNFKQSFDFEYKFEASVNADQPIDIHSGKFESLNYGAIVYRKSALILDYLKSYLGDTIFDRCMQNYFDQWHFKHPYPEDFKKVVEETSGKKLDWFFDDLLNTNKKVDYAISNGKKSDNEYVLTIANRSGLKSPVCLTAMSGDSVLTTKWIDGFEQTKQVNMPCNGCDHFQIDAKNIMLDIKPQNNYFKANGVFRKWDPINLNLLGHFDYPHRARINFLPAIAWNEYNNWMAGFAIYNKFIPEKKFEYVFVPMFGFGDKEIAGVGNVSYSIFPLQGWFDRVSLAVGAKRFAFYNADFKDADLMQVQSPLHYLRFQPELQFNFRKSSPRSSIRNQVLFSAVYLNEQDIDYSNAIVVNDSTTLKYGVKNSINRTTYRAIYNFNNKRVLDPYGISVIGEGNMDYLKISFNANYLICYPKSKRGVHLNLFAGGFGFDNTESTYPFYLSSWGGLQDFWYDDFYFGRSETEGILSQQMTQHDGGFKVNVPYAKSNKWIATFGISADIPNLPISVFADIGTFNDAKLITSIYDVENSLLYDGGICVDFTALKIYVPFFKSRDIKEYQSGNHGIEQITLGKQIRFEFNLNQLNPFNLRKQFYN